MPLSYSYPTPFRLVGSLKNWRKFSIPVQGSQVLVLTSSSTLQFTFTSSIAILVESVHREALQRINTMSASKRGPCYSGVLDAVTGEISYGENFDMSTMLGKSMYERFYTNAHPLLRLRIDTHNQNLLNGITKAKDTAGPAGTHSEIVALDRALKKRQQRTSSTPIEGDMTTFYLHNRCTLTGRAGKTMDCCDNCHVLTRGVYTVLHT
jgi:hypothetical protein